MNELKLFSFEGSKVRTVLINDSPYFVGKDVAKILGYQNTSKALADHVDDEDKLNNDSLVSLGQRGGWLINESGLYSLILKSQLPSAKKFKRWVTGEVLPLIRKHGMYATEDLLDNPDLLIAVATELKQERAEKEAAHRQLKEQEHQVVFARSVEVSRNSVAVKVLATILKQNGVDIGQNRMFQWLRNNGYLSSRPGKSWNMPTQRSMNQGLFELKASPYFHNDGTADTGYTPLVTGKGQVYFVNKFKEEMVLGLEG